MIKPNVSPKVLLACVASTAAAYLLRIGGYALGSLVRTSLNASGYLLAAEFVLVLLGAVLLRRAAVFRLPVMIWSALSGFGWVMAEFTLARNRMPGFSQKFHPPAGDELLLGGVVWSLAFLCAWALLQAPQAIMQIRRRS